MKNLLLTVVVGFASGLAGSYVFYSAQPEANPVDTAATVHEAVYEGPRVEVAQPQGVLPSLPAEAIDFAAAANKVIPCVVYINNISKRGTYSFFDYLFDEGSQTQVSTGSGVIFTSDGYVVTNNHVVETAERIEVVYNKKAYEAELIGTDPSTDLAVLKIQASNLPVITLGDSKALQVGEWVVAVGNPFSLSSTVTAGIVSAKGRRIGVTEDRFPIESYIQTDAAINPGNSGGALVNKNGELVGINAAILSRTGSYSGYSFAIPIDIAQKVVRDLIRHGVVQRAFLGGNVIEYDYQNAKKYNLPVPEKDFRGVLIERVTTDGPADLAGLKPGDVITRINATDVNSKSSFEEELSLLSPGEKVTLSYLREGKPGTASLTLVNREGMTELIKRVVVSAETLGANLEAVEYGVKITKIREGIFSRLGVPENYTLITINRVRVKSPAEVIDFFEKYKGRVSLYGVNSAKEVIPYNFTLR
jgi:Do/DeqQ family serine protease